MHVAAWYRGSTGPKFTKFEKYVSIGQPPNAVALRCSWKCARYPLSKIYAPGNVKVDQSLRKSLKTCYALMPLIVPNIIALIQTMYAKSVTNKFYILQYFGASGDLLAKAESSLMSALVYSKSRTTNVPNFVLF